MFYWYYMIKALQLNKLLLLTSKFKNMKKTTIFLLSFFLFPIMVLAQKDKFSIVVRIPVQEEFQKEYIALAVNGPKTEKKANVVTFGIDFLVEKKISQKIDVYAGAGYFRSKFQFIRPFNHRLLNIGTDSVPLGTNTYNYIYNLIRFPVGLSYQLSSSKNKILINAGSEILFNFSFKNVYNGGKPFPGANNKLSHFQYSGISLNLFTCVKFPLTNSSFLELEPYVRLYYAYKQDEILYENPSESIRRSIDAVGLSIKYSLPFKKL